MRYFKRQETPYQIPKFKIFTGIYIGLLYAGALYSLLYMIRESMRIMSVTTQYDLWILTDREVSFYNLFYAFIALIFGQSICFSFWYERPKRFFEFGRYRRNAILTDQRFMNWNFLAWFAKIALVYSFTVGQMFRGSWHHNIDLIPEISYFFVLAILVLFLQTWTFLRLEFKRKSLKWMFISFMIISALSFGLSKVNLIDYKAVNESILSHNVHYKYKLDLPQADHSVLPYKYSLMYDVYMVQSKNDDSSKPIVVIYSTEIPMDSLGIYLNTDLSYFSEADVLFMTYRLFIDKDLKISDVIKLKKELSKTSIKSIGYVVNPIDQNLSMYNEGRYIESHLYPFYRDSLGNKKNIELLKKFNPTLIQYEGDSILVGDQKIHPKNFNSALTNLLKKDHKIAFRYNILDDQSYEQHIFIRSSILDVMKNLRDEYCLKVYGVKYDRLYDEEHMIDAHKQIPLRFMETLDNTEGLYN